MNTNTIQLIINLKKSLVISFVGLPWKNTKIASIYTHHGRFTLKNNRLQSNEMKYSRHISKVIMIRKGNQLLFGKRCKKCGKPIPKSHGNCFTCYSENIEVAKFNITEHAGERRDK